MNDLSPCMNCDSRKPGCHDKCDLYKEWKANRMERLAHEKAERLKEGIFLGYVRDSSQRIKKEKRFRKK